MEGKKRKQTLASLENCKYEVVHDCVVNAGFKSSKDTSNWILCWMDTGISIERLLEMKSWQKINHFPGMHEICRKNHLARNISRLSRLFPKAFGFFPKTFILPHDWKEFEAYAKSRKSYYLAKPDRGCQGKGIFLFKDPEAVKDLRYNDHVVQTYLSSSLLLDGYKFDLRVYVLVTSVSPLRVFVYKEGLARFATEKYSPPNSSNMNNMFMHLTNFAINKSNENFVYDENVGSKRSISSVLKDLEAIYGKNNVWKRICDCIIKTLLVVQPQLSKVIKEWFPSSNDANLGCGSQCFEILGFDIILDSKLKPWVLEVNHSPSFTCDSPLDLAVKSGVISEALKLINLNPKIAKQYAKKEKERSQTRLWKSESKEADVKSKIENDKPTSSRSSESQSRSDMVNSDESELFGLSTAGPIRDLETPKNKVSNFRHYLECYYGKYDPKALENLSKFEDENLENYQRIFPPSEESKLGSYLHLMYETGKISSETATTKARKAFREQKIEEELLKRKKLENWKEKRLKKLSTSTAKVDYKLKRDINHEIHVPMKQKMEKQPIFLSTQTLNDSIQGGWVPIAPKAPNMPKKLLKYSLKEKELDPLFNQLLGINQLKNVRIGVLEIDSEIFLMDPISFDDLALVSKSYQEEILKHAKLLAANGDSDAGLFAGINLIWHLMHLMVFSPKEEIYEYIKDWAFVNHSDALARNYNMLNEQTHPIADSLFWPVIYQLALRGNLVPCLNLLKRIDSFWEDKSSCSAANAFSKLITSKPNIIKDGSEFKAKFDEWSNEAQFLYADGTLSSLNVPDENFKLLFGVLAGDDNSIATASKSWLDVFLAKLGYKYPMALPKDCGDILDQIPTHFKTDHIIDQIQYGILELNIPDVLQLCSHYDLWLVTHLVNILEMANLIEKDLLTEFTREKCTLTEWYCNIYADFLLSESKLWMATLEYFLKGGSLGKESLYHVILRIPLDSERKTRKLLAFCERNALHDAKTGILNVLGKRALDSGVYGEAILYYSDAKKYGMVAYIIEKVLNQYQKTGDKSCEFADSLSSTILASSPSLAFISRYRDFQKLYKNGEYQEAATLLVLLLTSGAAPRSFWYMLLLDALPLLEGDLCVFNSTETIEMMRCVEDLSARNLQSKENLVIVKMALVRNLARAMVV